MALRNDGRWLGYFHDDDLHGSFLGTDHRRDRIASALYPQSGSKPSEDSLEILKRRNARGEIGKEEFESKKRDILT